LCHLSTAREAKGIATLYQCAGLEEGTATLPTANANILNYWSAMQREMGHVRKYHQQRPRSANA
jgi:hypothetical protein